MLNCDSDPLVSTTLLRGTDTLFSHYGDQAMNANPLHAHASCIRSPADRDHACLLNQMGSLHHCCCALALFIWNGENTVCGCSIKQEETELSPHARMMSHFANAEGGAFTHHSHRVYVVDDDDAHYSSKRTRQPFSTNRMQWNVCAVLAL